ncbi:MAG: efflux RND transporter periplasmic adaptor subunit [Bryobacteraceae bacterium]|jgi:RND family efflux transporter MFP subunit
MNQEEKMPASDVVRPPAGLGPAARVLWSLLLAATAALAGLLVFRGIQERVHAESTLARRTEQRAVPSVQTIQPKRGARAADLVLPGNMQAFTDAPVYARTNGYLRRWYVDIGARVRAGQLLAEIETPEIDQQLRQARAELATAQANHKLAKSTAERWQDLRKTESVAQQETDEKLGDLESKGALMEAAGANVKRLEETQAFQKIYAPFDGVITARNIDIGDLIDAGGNGPGKELFHLAAVGQMRVYVQVPQMNSRSTAPGTAAELYVPEMPGRGFAGRVARTSDSMDPASRTLKVEVDVDNPHGVLMPGEFVEVHFKLPAPVNSLTLPVNALLFRAEGMCAAAVRDGRVVLLPVTIGHDYGDSLEVIAGLRPDERIVVNPPDSLASGQMVQVVPAGAQP